MAVRERDPLQVGGLAAESADRLEDAPPVPLPHRVDQRQLAAVGLGEEGLRASALLLSEAMQAGCNLHGVSERPHAA